MVIMTTEYSINEIEAYYSECFSKDLKGYFENGRLSPWGGCFPSRRNHKEWVIFVSLTASFYAIQVCLEQKWSRDSAIKLMYELGVNWMIFNADFKLLESFLERSGIKREINQIKEIEDILDVAPMVLQFVIERLEPFFNSYQSDGFKKEFFDKNFIVGYIRHSLFETLRILYRQYKPSTGLTGIVFNSKIFSFYYRQKFLGQLKRYFKSAKDDEGFVEILYIYDGVNDRWEDGRPGDDATENIMFSIIFMYMIMAEQTFLEKVKFREVRFHQCSKWPFISSGPGAGPYLHPLRTLELAGLIPTKSETSLYLEMALKIFPVLREEFFSILNNKMNDVIDGHFRVRIKKLLFNEENNIKRILEEWAISSERTISEVIQKLGFRIVKPF
jgi:hypothetical protein